MYSRQVHSFGSYMNKKYLMRSTNLADAKTSISAIRLILEHHVVY